jgi:hypothetical protein
MYLLVRSRWERGFVAGLLMTFVVTARSADGADTGPAQATKTQFTFRDTGEAAGIFPHAAGMRGHGVAWGDVDGDGWPDLFVTSFANAGSKPSVFLRNEKGKFRLDDQPQLRTVGSGSGALFADLTNSGRLDLYVSNCVHGSGKANQDPSFSAPSALFRNDGNGKFSDVSQQSGACPPGYAGRGLAALDFDGDGLVDLATCERYYGSVQTGPCLYHNKGNLQFENVAQAVGLPAAMSGLGVAAADVNADGWPDLFLTGGSGDHRLYLNDGQGKFREAPGSREVFQWKNASDDNTPAGVSIADVNGDGLPDIVIGHHFKRPWVTPAPVRLYLNQGVKEGNPTYRDVTESAGLMPLAMKAPHVEIQDFDNDGLPDLYVSVVKFSGGQPYPVIYKNLGVKDGLPRFSEDVWGVNDFPTAEDRSIKGGAGGFGGEKKWEKRITYSAAAPSCDYDRDGRLDLFLADWWIENKSMLLRNETKSGNWLDVQVEGANGVNRMGVGAKVRVYAAGKRTKEGLLGEREIAAGYGYCAGQEAEAHFGLGNVETVDLQIVLPHGKGQLVQVGVKANQRLTVKAAAGNALKGESSSKDLNVATKKKLLVQPVAQKSEKKAAKEPAVENKSVEKKAKAKAVKPAEPAVTYPPTLPDGKQVVTDTSEEFLKPPPTLREGVAIAKTPPTVDFLYYPGQNYPGNPWSNWGDSIAVGDKYYASIGDHRAIGRGNDENGVGTGLVFEYDPQTKTVRTLCDLAKVLKMPEGHYVPSKIHSRLDMGSDGCLYFATHRGSTTVTSDKNHYLGDWIFRCDPRTGKTEVVVQGPVPKHCIPNSVLDPDRLIFYGGTAPGTDSPDQDIQFFAYDVKNKKLLYSGPNGPARYMIFARSTGKLYYTQGKAGKNNVAALMRFDPASGASPVEIPGEIGIRAATQETADGMVYAVSQAGKDGQSMMYSFNTKTEAIEKLGAIEVGTKNYVATLDVDRTGRYVYYIPGAHGGSEADGSAIVQFDVKTRQKKVIAFLHPFYKEKYGATLAGTYSSAVSPKGDKLFITWNINRGSKAWDSCGLTVVSIPESERMP